MVDGDESPIVFPDNDHFEMVLNNLERLSFSVADNPFFRADVAKYYPECHVINSDTGMIMATINPINKSSNQFSSLSFVDNFRDEKLKINDDRKIKFDLENLKSQGICILLTVRTFDTRGEKLKEGAYDQAWFRIQNEDTNQTLDYTKVNDVDISETGFDPAAENGAGEDEEEEIQTGERNELIYIAGRIYIDAPKIMVKRGDADVDDSIENNGNEEEKDLAANPSGESLKASSIH